LLVNFVFQALDQDFTEENRLRCAEAAKPLTDAVDELTTFASSPEFASMPAKISPEVQIYTILIIKLLPPAWSFRRQYLI
jgi:hypothetical protein